MRSYINKKIITTVKKYSNNPLIDNINIFRKSIVIKYNDGRELHLPNHILLLLLQNSEIFICTNFLSYAIEDTLKCNRINEKNKRVL